MSGTKLCKDCEPGSKRPAPHPGPRCATHHRAVKKARSAASHERAVQATYNLKPGDYERLYTAQGGLCALCRRASGASKRLAVDHDHKTGEVFGLLCSVCNYQVLGIASRRDVNYFIRAIDYLRHPPYCRLTP